MPLLVLIGHVPHVRLPLTIFYARATGFLVILFFPRAFCHPPRRPLFFVFHANSIDFLRSPLGTRRCCLRGYAALLAFFSPSFFVSKASVSSPWAQFFPSCFTVQARAPVCTFERGLRTRVGLYFSLLFSSSSFCVFLLSTRPFLPLASGLRVPPTPFDDLCSCSLIKLKQNQRLGI